jgi:hypothetical protein
MRVEDLYGEKKEEFFYKVKNILHEELKPIGFNLLCARYFRPLKKELRQAY